MSEKVSDRTSAIKSAPGQRESYVDALATQALCVLAERRSVRSAVHRAAHLRELFDSSIEPEGEHVCALVREILRLGVPTETVTDIYIPEVARRLGAAWLADRLSFVEVTIGTARLQAVARDLAVAPDTRNRSGCRVVVIVPCNEDHTLGAVLLTGQLRRMGVAVALHMGQPSATVAEALQSDRPDAVMISAAHADCVESIAELVETSRRAVAREVPIAVGGPILELDDIDVLTDTRADYAVSEAAEALSLCSLGRVKGPAVAQERAG